jgi:hypothetical protein
MLAVLNAKFEGRLLEVTEKLGQSGKVVALIRQKFGVGRVKEEWPELCTAMIKNAEKAGSIHVIQSSTKKIQ